MTRSSWEVTGQLLEPDRVVPACRVVEPDSWCRRCGCEGAPRDTVTRRRDGRLLGFKTAATEELPEAVAVTDPFHVIRLAGDALDRCRRSVQQDLHGPRVVAPHRFVPECPLPGLVPAA